MKKKTKIVTSTLITITAAVLCATILITAITHRDWFAASSSTNSDTSSMIETIIIEQTASDETTTSETEPEPQETSSQQPTSQPAAPSKPTPSPSNVPSTPAQPTTKIPREPLPEGVVCGYSWLENIARAATEEELQAYKSQKGWDPYCEDCGRPTMAMSVDGQLLVCGAIYGTCMSHWTGGDWYCECCGAGPIPVDTCHTCGVPVVIEPLPGITINSPDQLTDAHKEYLYDCAAHIVKNNFDATEKPELVAVYSFVLTDNTALSTRSKCVCFFVYSVYYPSFDKTVYHAGEMFDMYINEREKLRYTASIGSGIWYTSEADAVAAYQKVGTNVSKIR